MTVLEKIGTVCGFIPGVSIISGIIKAVIYSRRAKACREARLQMEKTASKIDEIVRNPIVGKGIVHSHSVHVNELLGERIDPSNDIENIFEFKANLYGGLVFASILQMIPVFGNLMGSHFEIFTFKYINQVKEYEKQDAQNRVVADYLGIELPEEEDPKKEFLEKVLITFANLGYYTQDEVIKNLYESCSEHNQEYEEGTPASEILKNQVKIEYDRIDEELKNLNKFEDSPLNHLAEIEQTREQKFDLQRQLTFLEGMYSKFNQDESKIE